MRRIVIEIYDHTDDAEVAECVEAIRGIGFAPRLVDIPKYEGGPGTDSALARGIVYAASQDGRGCTLTAAEAEALWLSILQDSRSVAALKG